MTDLEKVINDIETKINDMTELGEEVGEDANILEILEGVKAHLASYKGMLQAQDKYGIVLVSRGVENMYSKGVCTLCSRNATCAWLKNNKTLEIIKCKWRR